MLKDYSVENFRGSDGEALLVLRHSLWNRETRDFLLTENAEGNPGVRGAFGITEGDPSSGRIFRGREHLKCSSFDNLAAGEGPLTVETVHRIHNSAVNTDGGSDDFRKVVHRLCDTVDFRELCRIFGERFSAVSAFDIRYELTFVPRKIRDNRTRADNKLTYMRVEITCRRVYEEDVISFFELLRYRDGDNYELYWDNMPDVSLHFSNGRARGCNAFMRGLIVYDMHSDGVKRGVPFALILPVICAFSRIAASQFDYIIPLWDRIGKDGLSEEGRSVWVSPDGRVMHSSVIMGCSTWEEYYRGWQSPGDIALVRGVLLSSPGETVVVSRGVQTDGLSKFLALQERIYKNTITD